jgi:hypothetical protein
MPTYDEIPARHPVLEHAEARMRLQPSPLQRTGPGGGDASASPVSPFWSVAAGVLGGVAVLGVGAIVVRLLT